MAGRVKAALKEEENYSEYSDNEIEDPPPTREELAKKPATRTSLVGIGRKIEKLIQQLCKQVPESEEISNKCEFKCVVCDKRCHGFKNMRSHASRAHGQHLSMTKVSEIVTKAFTHVCRICSASTLCDLEFIQRHLNKHNMLMKQYKEEYTENLMPKGNYSGDVLGNLCVFQCRDCSQKFQTTTSLFKHEREFSHGDRNSLNHFQSLIEKVYHKCKLCHRHIICTISRLHQHFRRCHNISLKEYCKKTGCRKAGTKIKKHLISDLKSLKLSTDIRNQCVFKCDQCTRTFFSLKSFKKHMNREHKTRVHMYVNNGTAYPWMKHIIKGYSYKCEHCSRLMLCDPGVIQEHLRHHHGLAKDFQGSVSLTKKIQYSELRDCFFKVTPIARTVFKKTIVPISKIPIQERTSKIGNLCIFLCPKCDSDNSPKFPSWCALLQHCKTAHKTRRISYHPSLVSVARYHSCLICPKAVLSDRQFIARHLKTMHDKVGLPKYEKTICKKGGQILPTYRDWSKVQWWSTAQDKREN